MIRRLFAFAVAAFVLSLPLARTAIGAKLRLIAAHLLHPRPAAVHRARALLLTSDRRGCRRRFNGSGGLASVATGLSCFGLLVLLSLVSFGLLSIRKRYRKVKKDPWDLLFTRGGGKQRVKRDDISDEPFDLEGW